MIVKDLSKTDLAERIATSGICLDTGAFRTLVRSDVGTLVEPLLELYSEFPIETGEVICDFFVRISAPSRFRQVFRPQVRAYIDEEDPFEPMARDLALPLFESALNWCIATQTQRHLLLHSGVVAKDGCAMILPAPSGSGKSTLSAYLSLNGWRLLSDEFGIISLEDGSVIGNPRPISLKNESISELAKFGGDGFLSQPFEGTIKGTIAYLRPFGPSLSELTSPCSPTLVVFPSFERGAKLKLEAVGKAEAFHRIIQNSVNYLTHRQVGFDTISQLVEGCGTFELCYSDHREAIDALTGLLSDQAQGQSKLPA